MSEPILVNVRTEAFEATLPWSRAIDARTMLAIAACPDSVMQAAYLIEQFRNQLAQDKLDAFDQLDIIEMTEVVGQWMDQTNKLTNERKALQEAARVVANADQPQPTPSKRRWWPRRS